MLYHASVPTRFQSTSVRRAALVGAVLFVAACAGLGARIAAPRVEVVGVRLDRVQDARAFLGVTVDIANPNPQPVDVEGFDAALAIEGEVVATAVLIAPVRVPANGSARAELAAQTGVDALVRAAVAAMRRGVATSPGRGPSLQYAIEGSAVFNGGLRVPFVKRGELGQGAVR
ncbi:MAG: LEA type 2 family protein [Casimicrobiaceae bacterium]